ncbi:hypothetical protein ASF21_03490 [Arthrobacter sp. Leaf234]|uniref:hypothetical protein n=1 Tax=Arthrobacter sp. Leaf234 TaxID=1736303 RepID=UPI0006F24E60|nr:hypothetical protein [Arthrobacter sp. Leaf234]KQO03372.1 hypothetical protein ASF21_03490 [Arthrobacter sp. Leaf234]
MRLEGWHIIVILGFLLVVAVIAGVILLGSAARRGPGPHSGQRAQGAPPDPARTPRTTFGRRRTASARSTTFIVAV